MNAGYNFDAKRLKLIEKQVQKGAIEFFHNYSTFDLARVLFNFV